jgi:putative cardiolipin synthase
VSETFDAFWNSQWSTSIAELIDKPPDAEALRALRQRLDRRIAEDTSFPFSTALTEPDLRRITRKVRKAMVWGEASVLADRPDKPETSQSAVVAGLHARIGDAIRHELLLESAYFVPAGNGTARLCDLVARGVSVRILTNSLASVDEPAVFAGYERHRKDLLRCGVELHELRPDARFVRHEWTWLKTRSEAELHTKAAVFDHREVLIGSFNMDPRSRHLNTELAILVESPVLAEKVAQFIESGMTLSNAYRVELTEDDDVRWVCAVPGGLAEFSRSPGASLWRSVETDLLSLLPIEELL